MKRISLLHRRIHLASEENVWDRPLVGEDFERFLYLDANFNLIELDNLDLSESVANFLLKKLFGIAARPHEWSGPRPELVLKEMRMNLQYGQEDFEKMTTAAELAKVAADWISSCSVLCMLESVKRCGQVGGQTKIVSNDVVKLVVKPKLAINPQKWSKMTIVWQGTLLLLCIDDTQGGFRF